MGGGAVIGAVGSLINMGVQQRAASRQSRLVEEQVRNARNDLMVQRERFEITKAAASDAYFRQRALLDSQHDMTRLQQEEQQLMQQQYDQQLSFQQEQLKQTAQQQISQVLQSKANAQTSADIASGQSLRALSERFMQSQQLGEQLYTQLAARGVGTAGLEELRRLDDVRTLQAGVESINTTDRQADYVNKQLQGQAGLLQSRANTASDYLASTRQYQQMMNELMNEYGYKDLQYTYDRNKIAAEASRYAQQAGILSQEAATSLNYRNQMSQLNMAKTQTQSPNWLGGILSVASQFSPQIVEGVQGLFNNTPVSAAAPHIGSGGTLNPVSSGMHTRATNPGVNIPPNFYNNGILSDVTGNVWG